jgi:hypothetical protein
MRAVVPCLLALLAAATLSTASSVPKVPSARAIGCATKADKTAIAAHSKASSFAPHPGSRSHVYGAPIQSRILKSRPAKKKPQLTSSPLPDSSTAETSSGG